MTSHDANGKPAGPILVNLANVKPEPVRWLWPGRIPLGKLTLLVGDPGLGKSFVTLDIAARVTRGAACPDDSSALAPAGGVVLLSAEDDPADTIRPRLDAAGADVARVNILTGIGGEDRAGKYQRAVNLARDIENLKAATEQTENCRLVVIDPISAYLGKVDSHKNGEVRGVLAPLAELAARRGVAVLAVTHLRKAEGDAIYRSMGSLAFTAAARAAWAVAKDRKNPARRLMVPVKSNLTSDVKGLAFGIGPYGVANAPAVAWESEPVDIDADEALRFDRRVKVDPQRQLLDFIRRKDRSVKVRDVTHGLRRYRGDVDGAEKALNELVKAGYGTWETDDHAGGRGRPGCVFRLTTGVTVTTNSLKPDENRISGDGDSIEEPAVQSQDSDRTAEANAAFAEAATAAEAEFEWGEV